MPAKKHSMMPRRSLRKAHSFNLLVDVIKLEGLSDGSRGLPRDLKEWRKHEIESRRQDCKSSAWSFTECGSVHRVDAGNHRRENGIGIKAIHAARRSQEDPIQGYQGGKSR